MYHLTTDTGLNVTTSDARDSVEALRAELLQRIADHPITWTIEVDGISQENGGINASQADHSPTQFIDETIGEVRQRLTASTS